MTIQFDLVKSTEALQFSLQKHDVTEIKPCQVTVAMDVSGSFTDEHEHGYTQRLLNRFIPFSMVFDKDKTINSYIFSHHHTQLTDITEKNYSNYIRNVVIPSRYYGGGTSYLPVLQQMLDDSNSVKTQGGFFSRLLGKTKTTGPEKHIHFFVTDGEAGDQNSTKQYLDSRLTNSSNDFIVFLSIGYSEFPFFKQNYKNTPYSSYFNFTPDELHRLDEMTDEDLYELLLTDSLIEWMNK